MHKQPARFVMCPGCGLHGTLTVGDTEVAVLFTKSTARHLLYRLWTVGTIAPGELPGLLEEITASPLPERLRSHQRPIRYHVCLDPQYGHKPEQPKQKLQPVGATLPETFHRLPLPDSYYVTGTKTVN